MELKQLIKANRSIIPVKLDKTPAVANWTIYGTRRPTKEEMENWQKTHTGMWAMVTGQLSGIVTLDFDGDAGAAKMRRLGLEPTRKTPRGHHVDFEWKAAPCKSGCSADVDIRGERGYVVVVGPGYQWINPRPYRTLPRGIRLGRLAA